jgi:hypothetical protein
MSGKQKDPADDDGEATAPNPPISIDWEAMDHVDCSSLTDMVRACISSSCKAESSQKTWGQFLVESLLTKACGGDLRALQEIWTRLEGRPGLAKSRPRPPIKIPDELAQMILNYGCDESDSAGEP